ncbi:hypothetical protein EXN66_Car018273 [Channa argus]|uniref:Uncharacterized protein n=1 Tax=Channa argus TaxID=215402 RepID=A0A6G1QJ65_CHAAH|nr:hypothetical protein EXN66_Car018273 [Channa argus]
MAPLGMVGTLGWFSSLEVGIISLVVFLILSVTVLALCALCTRSTENAYDVTGSKTDGVGGANGNVGTKTGGTADQGTTSGSTWRHHKNMPPTTLERKKAFTS